MNNQKNNSSINFIPLGGYSLKVAGILLLVTGLSLVFLSAMNWYDFKSYSWLISWLLVLSLTLINFSREKNESTRNSITRLIAFKTAGIFIMGLILGFELVSVGFNLTFSLSALTIAFLYNIVHLTSYIAYHYFSNIEIENYTEITTIENYKANSKLYLIWLILTVITLGLIVIIT